MPTRSWIIILLTTNHDDSFICTRGFYTPNNALILLLLSIFPSLIAYS